HSYLAYIRDRLVLARELLNHTGSVIVQISDENLHRVRSVLDEVFGSDNQIAIIPFVKTASSTQELLSSVADFLLWYAKDKPAIKFHQLYRTKMVGEEGASNYTSAEDPTTGQWRRLSKQERDDTSMLPEGWRVFSMDNLTSQRPPGS